MPEQAQTDSMTKKPNITIGNEGKPHMSSVLKLLATDWSAAQIPNPV